MQKKWLLLPLLLLGLYNHSSAQMMLGKNEIGLHVGALIYQGDLSPSRAGSVKTARPVVNFLYNRILNRYWSLRANLTFGSLYGNDSLFAEPVYMKHRNFNFRTPVREVSVLGVYNIYGNNDENKYVKMSTYLFGGIGLSTINTTRDYSQLDTAYFQSSAKLISGLSTDTAKILPRRIPIIPMGIGFRYSILPRISLVAEGMFRYTFTDYLDGFSYAASPKYKDSYYSVSIGAVFNFGKNKMACPTNYRWDK